MHVALVLFAVAGVAEAALAKLAGVRLVLGVRVHVLLQVLLGGADMVTQVAGIGGGRDRPITGHLPYILQAGKKRL